MRNILLLSLIVFFAQSPQPPAGAARGGAQPPAAQPPVTFKVEVNYVEIDANVTDAQGRFVRALTRDDFQVVEDGKPQTLSAFSMVDIPVTRPDPPLFSKTANCRRSAGRSWDSSRPRHRRTPGRPCRQY